MHVSPNKGLRVPDLERGPHRHIGWLQDELKDGRFASDRMGLSGYMRWAWRAGPHPIRFHAKTIRSPARASTSGRTIGGRCSVDNTLRRMGRDRPRVEQALAVVDAVVPRLFERLPLERHVFGELR